MNQCEHIAGNGETLLCSILERAKVRVAEQNLCLVRVRANGQVPWLDVNVNKRGIGKSGCRVQVIKSQDAPTHGTSVCFPNSQSFPFM